eukprot:scaffold3618_cov129-Cylindrotheca_fusiformis.AAC.12
MLRHRRKKKKMPMPDCAISRLSTLQRKLHRFGLSSHHARNTMRLKDRWIIINSWLHARQVIIRYHNARRRRAKRHPGAPTGEGDPELVCSVESKMTMDEISEMLHDDLAKLSIEHKRLNRRFVKNFKKRSLESLKILALNNNQCYRSKSRLRTVVQNLPKNLEELYLCWNGMDASICDALANRVAVLQNLATVRLCGNPIKSRGLASLLGGGCSSFQHISHLDLSDCDIGDDDAAHQLAEFLSNSKTSLKSLTLKMNGIGTEGAKIISKGLVTSQHLRALNLQCNEIDDDGVEALMTALSAEHSALEELDLSANAIRDIGATAIARSLHKTKLKRLFLNHNFIGDEGIEHIAKKALDGRAGANKLQELSACSNFIGDKSVTCLSDALRSNQTLHRLMLTGNKRIGRRSVSTFEKCLLVNKTLFSLEILEDTYDNHLVNEKLDFYLKRNFVFQHCIGNDLPIATLPLLVGRVERADALFSLVQLRPELFQY